MQSYKYNSGPASTKGKGQATVHSSISANPVPFPFPRKSSIRRPQISENTFSRPVHGLPTSKTTGVLDERDRSVLHSSKTWSSSSGDINLISEPEEVDDREEFVDEYNRLAKKHGIRPIVPGDYPPVVAHPSMSLPDRRGSWISKLFGHNSSAQPTEPPAIAMNQQLRQRRSISDIALDFVHNQKREGFKNVDLRTLVRLCGKSTFYLPAEYAPGSLVLPTCFRATAQCLVQNAEARGIFRIPGSVRIVNALYEYYCADLNKDDIASTTRCPTLPTHLNCGVYDVASVFKRLLAGLPGGILGSLALFDALVAIHSQLNVDAEQQKTKESKLRARLIALAIGTVKSQYQREIICSVFGLLSLIGRVAENAPREDVTGRPLPTSDLMGYGALGIIFGPLLIGDLINSYKMKVAVPTSGLVLLPLTPPKSKKHKKSKTPKTPKTPKNESPILLTVDRIHVANDITEMLIMNWREVVRHLRSLNVLRTHRDVLYSAQKTKRGDLRSSASDSFSIKKPADWSAGKPSVGVKEGNTSPVAVSPTPSPRLSASHGRARLDSQAESLSIKRRRPRPSSSASSYRLPTSYSANALSPTAEESPGDVQFIADPTQIDRGASFTPISYEPVAGDKSRSVIIAEQAEGSTSPRTERKSTKQKSKSSHQRIKGSPLESGGNISPSEMRRSTIRSYSAEHLAGSEDTVRPKPQIHSSKSGNAGSHELATGHQEAFKPRQTKRSSAGHTPLRHDRIFDDEFARDIEKDNAKPRSSKKSSAGHTPLRPGQLVDDGFVTNVDEDAHKPRSKKGSSAGNTPLRHDQESSSRSSTIIRRLLRKEDGSKAVERKEASKEKPVSRQPYSDENDENIVTPIDSRAPELYPSESEHITPLSDVEKFPSFHPSVVETVWTPPDFSHSVKRQVSTGKSRGVTSEAPLSERPSDWLLNQQAAIPMRSAELLPEHITDAHSDTPTRKGDQTARWKELVKNSPASSVASIKERRKSRKSMHLTNRPSGESLFDDNKRTTTPEWKRQILNKKNEEKRKPPALPLEKKTVFENSPQSTTSQIKISPPKASPSKVKGITPAKSWSDATGRPLSQRSSSKPVGGAIKAMAAMFDNALQDSPEERKSTLTGRARTDLRSSNSFMSQYTKGDSPIKSVKSTVTPMNVTPQRTFEVNKFEYGPKSPVTPNRTFQTSFDRVRSELKPSPTRVPLNDTPTRFPTVALRPIYAAARNEPVMSPSKVKQRERELSRPPSLGTMIPHREEPPVAQHLTFARPPSAASSASHLTPQPAGTDSAHAERTTPLPVATGSPLPGTENSSLHAQIRTLQRQLEARNDEVLQLRRQLETRTNMDFGTLSEQLREAKRECKMWRDRAEAAEKRVAVFEKFTAKVRRLREGDDPNQDANSANQDAADDGPKTEVRRGNSTWRREDRGKYDSSSSCTDHTEDQDAWKSRIRRSMKKTAGDGADGTGSSENDDNEADSVNDDSAGAGFVFPIRGSPKGMRWKDRNVSQRTAQLWLAAEELLSVQGGMNQRE